MKSYYFSLLLLIAIQARAQQTKTVSAASNTLLKQSDASLILISKYDAKNRSAETEKPKLVTAEDKKLWNRPVTQNPNYLKLMPLKDPNEIEISDKE